MNFTKDWQPDVVFLLQYTLLWVIKNNALQTTNKTLLSFWSQQLTYQPTNDQRLPAAVVLISDQRRLDFELEWLVVAYATRYNYIAAPADQRVSKRSLLSGFAWSERKEKCLVDLIKKIKQDQLFCFDAKTHVICFNSGNGLLSNWNGRMTYYVGHQATRGIAPVQFKWSYDLLSGSPSD